MLTGPFAVRFLTRREEVYETPDEI